MKLVQINEGCGVGSIGKICVAVSQLLTQKNIENYIYYTYDNSSYPLGIKYANKYYIKLQALKSRISGNYGFVTEYATKKLIEQLNNVKPDIIHLHNLHGHSVNLELLFDYIRKNHVKVFWTFHDCWAFTGYCPYFTMPRCDKWMTGCGDCPQKHKYTWFFDNSANNWQRKKRMLEGIDLNVITPSEWLADLTRKSLFKDFQVEVINNGIDLEVFKPTESDFRKKYSCESKFILLGVAFDWASRKGLDVFIELSKRLHDNYQIVLVGTDDKIDRILPDNIISIHRTKNQTELAEIYTAADLFVNPTREDNYPTVNMESIACGTPVLTFNTGGSPEMLDENTGDVVECDDIDALFDKIISITQSKKYDSNLCRNKAKQFNKDDKFKEYLKLYEIESE